MSNVATGIEFEGRAMHAIELHPKRTIIHQGFAFEEGPRLDFTFAETGLDGIVAVECKGGVGNNPGLRQDRSTFAAICIAWWYDPDQRQRAGIREMWCITNFAPLPGTMQERYLAIAMERGVYDRILVLEGNKRLVGWTP